MSTFYVIPCVIHIPAHTGKSRFRIPALYQALSNNTSSIGQYRFVKNSVDMEVLRKGQRLFDQRRRSIPSSTTGFSCTGNTSTGGVIRVMSLSLSPQKLGHAYINVVCPIPALYNNNTSRFFDPYTDTAVSLTGSLFPVMVSRRLLAALR
ncbi:hypothetical protein BaRGS_00006495 [Batillaria attramentaria]|uniref:Uncharacterized protein n=1 Tax=Batillaria attramentaria TaxID=370345 RepID=A0ABD0LSI9_9CAEN